jgi:hypothetical protein
MISQNTKANEEQRECIESVVYNTHTRTLLLSHTNKKKRFLPLVDTQKGEGGTKTPTPLPLSSNTAPTTCRDG